jgi:hypothetical protein
VQHQSVVSKPKDHTPPTFAGCQTSRTDSVALEGSDSVLQHRVVGCGNEAAVVRQVVGLAPNALVGFANNGLELRDDLGFVQVRYHEFAVVRD